MNDDPELIPQPGEAPVEWKPYSWYALLGGLALLAVAGAISALAGAGPVPAPGEPAKWTATTAIRVTLCLAGMLAMGVGVWLRPAHVGALALAAVGGLLAHFSFPMEFDSGRMLAVFGAIIAGSAAVLLAVPRPYRRVAVVVLVLVHFGSVLASTTGPGTNGAPPPWITQVANVYFYRAYSQFVYLTNAYHFYSPEPGPASQVWFCVYYDNEPRDPKTGKVQTDAKTGEPLTGDTRWFKLPRRPEDMTDPLALSYYRRLSLTMQMENYAQFYQIPPETYRRRDLKSVGNPAIPWHPDFAREQQYRPPNEAVRKFIIPSYVRHVTHMKEMQHEDGHTHIRSVKVYRVEHRILPPQHIKTVDPYDLSTYVPYFQGEYDAEGEPINLNDPMLFWIVPIVWKSKTPDVSPWHNRRTHPQEFELIDGVQVHSHSNHEG